MSLIHKKSDVKNHLSSHRHNHIHIAIESQPDATGFSEAIAAPVETNPAGSAHEASFTRDFTGNHTSATPVIEIRSASSGRLPHEAPADPEGSNG